MQSKAITVEDYLKELPEDRIGVIKKLRQAVKKNLPKGFEEGMGYGMIGYWVPHSIYPNGYHCDPKLPLPFMNIASQKNFIAVYYMGWGAKPDLLQWFTDAHAKISTKKLDMGKACIRYKKPEDIPIELIGELASKVNVKEWIDYYEKNIKSAK